MEYLAQQFVLAAKKIRIELEAIKQELSSLHADLQKQTEAITEAAKAANAKQSVPPEVRAEVNLPEGVEIRKSAADASDDKKYQRRTLFVASLTLVAIVGYAVLVYFQWQEMIGATDAAQRSVDETRRNRIQADKALAATIEQFHLDQRAWIGVKSVRMITLEPRQKVHIDATLVNTGKTFANKTKVDGILVSHGTPLDIDKYAETLGPQPKSLAPSLALLYPAIEVSVPAYSDSAINEATTSAIKGGTEYVYFFGTIRYTDVFNARHVTRFCYWYFPGENAFHSCPQYSYAD